MTTLIKQRSGNDCVLAAISMAAGHTDWSQLWTDKDLETVQESRGVGDEEPWMLRAGFIKYKNYKRIHVYNSSDQGLLKVMLWNRRALLSVNSLNVDGGSHMIFWDGAAIFDPSTERTFLHLSSVHLAGIIVFDTL